MGYTTPRDELTGVVYPIYFSSDQLVLTGKFHHPGHPNPREALQDEYGQALRVSRVQWVPDIYHMDIHPNAYHLFLDGPRIPASPGEKISTALLNCAGVVPRR